MKYAGTQNTNTNISDMILYTYIMLNNSMTVSRLILVVESVEVLYFTGTKLKETRFSESNRKEIIVHI